MIREEVSQGLRSLLTRLTAYKVDWRFSFVPSDEEDYEVGIDREVSDLDEANVISSELKPLWPGGEKRHAVLLDIDYDAHLVESSSGGHHHLYLNPPGGIKHDDYMELLEVLGRVGVIEKGYAQVSIARGHSDLRLPWVSKQDQVLHDPDEPGVNQIESPHHSQPGDDSSPFDVVTQQHNANVANRAPLPIF